MDKTTVGFGRRLRALREARGLSQDALAAAADLHRNYVGMLERGQTGTTLETLATLAAALELSLPELLDFELPTTRRTVHDQRVDAILELLRDKAPRDVERALKILKLVFPK